MCEKCRERAGSIVHHKTVLTPQNIADPDVSLSHKQLALLCKHCHDREEAHAFIKQGSLRCAFDETGQPIPPIERVGSDLGQSACED